MDAGQFAHARVALDRVTCLRGGRLLFERLSFGLGPGDAAMVTGANGAGKSSLLRIVAGLLVPEAGTVAVAGDVALDTEATALDMDMSLERALAFWGAIDRARADAVADAMAAMGLERLGDVPIRLLSSGQRRRAGLARMIAGGACIWLLDEPGNGLDARALDRLAAAMAGHRAAGGIVLAASHMPLGLTQVQEIAL